MHRRTRETASSWCGRRREPTHGRFPGQARNAMKTLPPNEAIGERVARRMLLVILARAFASLAAVTVYVFLKKPHIAYSAPTGGADLPYLNVWRAVPTAG